MKHFGAQPDKVDHRDYDFIQSHKEQIEQQFGTGTPQFLPSYSTDAGFGFPDQNAEGQPYGCTNYTQASLASDLTGKKHYPDVLERLTHANARGGYSIRESLNTASTLGWFTAYYNIKPYAPLDWFDAIRLAISSGIPEKRSVSIGTPWFKAWEGPVKILIMPTLSAYGGWHDWSIVGWETIGGEAMLRLKSWQGDPPAYQYLSRETINTVMTLNGTVAFTATDNVPDDIKTIPVSWFRYLLSLIGLRY